jgi:hypothetical protein
MNEGKAKVIGEVIKQQGMFKAARIVNATGLGRSLVHHHMQNLVAEGFLEKDGMYYGVVARQDLVDALVNIGENRVTGLFPIEPPVLDKQLTNEYIEIAVLLRSAKVNGGERMRMLIGRELDKVIDQCKGAKRYLNSKELAEKKALIKLDNNWDEYWEHIRKFVKIDKDDLHMVVVTKLEEMDKNED